MTDNTIVILLYLACNAFRVYSIFVFLSLFYTREENISLAESFSYIGYFVVNSAIYLIWENPVSNIINNVCILFILTLFLKLRWATRALATIITFAVSILVENVVSSFFQFDLTKFESSITMTISSLLLFAVVFGARSLANIKEDKISSVFHSFIISLISAISIFIAIVITFPNLRYKHIWAGVSMALLLLMNFMVIYLYDSVRDQAKQTKAKELLQQQNNLYIKQYETIFNSQENIRILRHDMKGHMTAIQALLKKGTRIEVADYIQNIYQTLSPVGGVVNTGNVAIDSVLNCKLQEADILDIKFKLRLKVPAQLKILPFDLSTILVNLLDNAINAVKKLEQADPRSIVLSLELERGVLYINITNPFDGNVLFQDGRVKTTHPDPNNHGYGLPSIQKALEKYNGTINVKQQNNSFIVEVLLYNTFPVLEI